AAQRTGVVLTPLFERALHVAKTVRSTTGMSDHAVSVSTAAVELAKKIFAHLPEHTVMVLGAGETSELAARHLIRQGVTRLFVANRSPQRPQSWRRHSKPKRCSGRSSQCIWCRRILCSVRPGKGPQA